MEEKVFYEKVDGKDKTTIVSDGKKVTRIASFDAVPVMTQAQFERFNGANGWSKTRNMRSLGEVPLEQFFHMQWNAALNQEELTGTKLKKWLESNPEYKTCQNIFTRGKTNDGPLIVVK
jgi:hypothetical protein